MSRPEPRFAIGERVITRHRFNPRYNFNNAAVIERRQGSIRCPIDGSISKGWVYRTDHDDLSLGMWWRETSLRPRPKPSSQTFSELMEECKSGEIQLIGESE